MKRKLIFNAQTPKINLKGEWIFHYVINLHNNMNWAAVWKNEDQL